MIKRPIQTNERGIRTVHGRVDNNAGTLAIEAGQGYSVALDSTGVVSVTLEEKGRTIVGASCIPIQSTGATGHFAKVLSITEPGVVQFATFVADATDGAPANVDFFFSISVKDVEL